MSLVAEVCANGENGMIGVGNLFRDPDGQSAEFAVLVADAWQGRGVGDVLTDCCTGIAGDWGLQSIRAETGQGNAKMISLFNKRGFSLNRDDQDDVVVVHKDLR
jgi:acetyltransferase